MMSDNYASQSQTGLDSGSDVESTRAMLDQLFLDSRLYTQSKDYKELLDFVASLPNFAPFNAMLLQIQKPGLNFAASAHDWRTLFGRKPVQKARPLLILWPFGPVALVYDELDTEGDKLPRDVRSFYAEGPINEKRIERFRSLMATRKIHLRMVDEGDRRAGSIQLLGRAEDPLILSKLLASRMFPEGGAIGQSIKPTPDEPWYLVVGVAGNVKNSGLIGESEPEYYRLRRNFIADWDPRGIGSVIILATVLPPSAVAPWIRSQIARIDPTTPVDIETLNQQVSKLAARPRFETALLGFFAFAGLLMAVIGLYCVTAFVATQRTQEIGVRMALGASRFNILRMILWQGGRLIAIGGLVGLGIALALARVLKSLLFGLSPYDPMSFIGVALLVTIVALVATLVPARFAMTVDPWWRFAMSSIAKSLLG